MALKKREFTSESGTVDTYVIPTVQCVCARHRQLEGMGHLPLTSSVLVHNTFTEKRTSEPVGPTHIY